MIKPEDIKIEMGWDLSDTSKDVQLVRIIERCKGIMASFTNNTRLFDKEDAALDDVVLYLACMRASPDTKHGVRAGKESENVGGVSYSFSNSIPDEVKEILKPYRRSGWY